MLVFSLPFFFCEFHTELPLLKEPGIDPRGVFRLQTIRIACLCTTLMALRDLEDVLAPKEGRKDDLKANTLGYPGCFFLSSEERKIINKVVMHSTAFGVNSEGRLSLDGTAVLDVQELVWKGIAQGRGFLKWVMDNYSPATHAQAWCYATASVMFVETAVSMLNKFAQRQKISGADPTGEK